MYIRIYPIYESARGRARSLADPIIDDNSTTIRVYTRLGESARASECERERARQRWRQRHFSLSFSLSLSASFLSLLARGPRGTESTVCCIHTRENTHGHAHTLLPLSFLLSSPQRASIFSLHECSSSTYESFSTLLSLSLSLARSPVRCCVCGGSLHRWRARAHLRTHGRLLLEQAALDGTSQQ